MKIGDYIKSTKKQPFKVRVFGRIHTVMGYVEGVVGQFVGEHMVQVNGLLYPKSIFENQNPVQP